MEQLLEYRQRLLARYEESAREFCNAVEAANRLTPALSEVEGSTREAGEWNAHQIAAHTRDVQKMVYGLRVVRTLEEEDPLFENFDGEAWMAEHYNPNEPLASVLDELLASVRETLARLKGLSPEAWARTSRHETYGAGFTTQTWAERGLAHIEEHLKTVKEAG